MPDYDLVVIGSGPAGEKGAAQAAWLGKRVALVERKRQLGGACVNTGTLPSKTLRETALYLSGFRQRNLYALDVTLRGDLGVPELMCRQDPVIGTEIDRIHGNLDRHGVELLTGEARFVDEHTIEIGEIGAVGEIGEVVTDGKIRSLHQNGTARRRITTDVVLIATGSRPLHPPGIPVDDPLIDDSDSILALDRIPKTLVVLGGGVIGCEYASIFAALGVKVTLVESRERLLGFLDFEICDLLTRQLRDLGVDVRLHTEASLVERCSKMVHVRLLDARTRAPAGDLEVDRLLCAAGRLGNTSAIGLDQIGVTPDKRGLLAVDEHFRVGGTRGGRVYAAGDVIGFPALASTSMEQARVAMCHAFGDTYKTRVSEHLPYGLYTIPEASMIGETEESAAKKGLDYTVGRARYATCARGQIIGDLDGILKLVFRSDDRKLLGVHIVGARATELIHVGQMVIHFGGALDDLIYECFNYPTLSELYKIAAYDGLGNLARRRALEGVA